MNIIEMVEDADSTQRHKLTVEQLSTLIARTVAATIKKNSIAKDWLDTLPKRANECLIDVLTDFENEQKQNHDE